MFVEVRRLGLIRWGTAASPRKEVWKICRFHFFKLKLGQFTVLVEQQMPWNYDSFEYLLPYTVILFIDTMMNIVVHALEAFNV